ncbi:Hypothetical predicted protein [Octopus vulgaris]|uniref:Uncharacterized protein n=1 Tax=Octopus vulgaris TaxID=6645 RepID=A0AA36B394_OCTVU|nr:Hypothetical predicted protein [Octopus vulgaris]
MAVGTINVHEMGNDDQKKNEAYTTIRIQKKSGKKRINIDLRLKIDTGAQSDILPVNLYKKMFPEHMTLEDKVKEGILTPSDVILTAYGVYGDPLPSYVVVCASVPFQFPIQASIAMSCDGHLL